MKKVERAVLEIERLHQCHPSAEIMVAVTGDNLTGDYPTECFSDENLSVGLEELYCYNGEYLTRDDLAERLADDWADDFPEMDDDEFGEYICERIKNEFPCQKYIVIYV